MRTDPSDRQPAVGGEPIAALAHAEQEDAMQAARDANIVVMLSGEIFATRYRSSLLWDGRPGTMLDPEQSYRESRLLYGLVGQYLILTGATPGQYPSETQER
jgi:hypothetical protein